LKFTIIVTLRRALKGTSRANKEVLLVGIIILFVMVVLSVTGQFYLYDPTAATSDIFAPPSIGHIMGTDQLGRDIFSRVVFGARYSLLVSFIAVGFSSIIGTPIGSISALFAGKLDRILSVIFDALYAFPGIILAILISVMIGQGVYTTGIAVGVTFIPQYYRVVRGLTLSLKERPFVEALRAVGARSRDTLLHLTAYAIPSIIVIMTLNMASAILQVSGLGFLGLGLPPPTPEWGTYLGRGRDFITSGVWWTSAFPGLMIFINVLAFTLIGEGLNELIKPKEMKE